MIEVHPTHGLSFFFVFLKDVLTEISQRSNTDHNVSTMLNHIYLQIPSRAGTVGPFEGIAVRRSTGGEIVRIRSLEYCLP